MTLRRLMQNYLTIQTSENAAQTDQGAIDRQASWITLESFKNVRCNVQEQKKRTLINAELGLVAEDHVDVIYHQNKSLYEYLPKNSNQIQLRIITHKDPRKKINFPVTKSDDPNIVIYQYMGHIEQVRHKRRVRLYQIRCSRNDRQVFA